METEQNLYKHIRFIFYSHKQCIYNKFSTKTYGMEAQLVVNNAEKKNKSVLLPGTLFVCDCTRRWINQYWKLLLVWISSRICCSSSSSNRPSKLQEGRRKEVSSGNPLIMNHIDVNRNDVFMKVYSLNHTAKLQKSLSYTTVWFVPGYERFCFFCSFRTQISQTGQLKLMKFLLQQ